MQLMMYIGNDLIESVQLESARIPRPGYIGSFKRFLKTKYSELIREAGMTPEFIVHSDKIFDVPVNTNYKA